VSARRSRNLERSRLLRFVSFTRARGWFRAVFILSFPTKGRKSLNISRSRALYGSRLLAGMLAFERKMEECAAEMGRMRRECRVKERVGEISFGG